MNDLKPMHTWITLTPINESDCAQPNNTHDYITKFETESQYVLIW
jgi:hypothetical protein